MAPRKVACGACQRAADEAAKEEDVCALGPSTLLGAKGDQVHFARIGGGDLAERVPRVRLKVCLVSPVR